MDVIAAINQRRSARSFINTPIPRDTILNVIQAALKAPSAMNLQPWQFYIVSGEEKNRLSRVLIKAYKEKQISCAPDTVKPLPSLYSQRGSMNSRGISENLKSGISFARFINEGSCTFYNAPTAVLIAQDDAFSSQIDIGITLGYLLLAAHDCGLASCPVGLISSYQDEIRELLNIPENLRVVLGIALGYPDDTRINRFVSERADSNEVVKWIE